jgi:arabinan endo-1,5-alpha-L-arabinosidase
MSYGRWFGGIGLAEINQSTGKLAYSIINANSLRSLDNYGNSATAGTDIAQWDYWAGNGQHWRCASPAAGYQTVANQLSGMVLDVKAKSLSENAQIIQYPLSNGTNQQWALQRR